MKFFVTATGRTQSPARTYLASLLISGVVIAAYGVIWRLNLDSMFKIALLLPIMFLSLQLRRMTAPENFQVRGGTGESMVRIRGKFSDGQTLKDDRNELKSVTRNNGDIELTVMRAADSTDSQLLLSHAHFSQSTLDEIHKVLSALLAGKPMPEVSNNPSIRKTKFCTNEKAAIVVFAEKPSAIPAQWLALATIVLAIIALNYLQILT